MKFTIYGSEKSIYTKIYGTIFSSLSRCAFDAENLRRFLSVWALYFELCINCNSTWTRFAEDLPNKMVSVELPWQSLPPFFGGGLEQVRCLVFMFLSCFHGDQALHSPCVAEWEKKKKEIRDCGMITEQANRIKRGITVCCQETVENT